MIGRWFTWAWSLACSYLVVLFAVTPAETGLGVLMAAVVTADFLIEHRGAERLT